MNTGIDESEVLLQCSLIQRVSIKDAALPEGKGVDARFRFDYMGSSEFEFGALGDALKRGRKEHAVIRKISYTAGSEKQALYFVGPKSELRTAELLVAYETGTEQYRKQQKTWFKERPHMRERLVLADKYAQHIYGWWKLEGAPFVVFVRREDAEFWLRTATAGPAT